MCDGICQAFLALTRRGSEVVRRALQLEPSVQRIFGFVHGLAWLDEADEQVLRGYRAGDVLKACMVPRFFGS